MRRRLAAIGLLAIPIVGFVLWRHAHSVPADPFAEVRDKVGMRSASPRLAQLRRDYPREAEVHFLSARQARLEGRTEEARAYLERAESLGWPGWPIARERALQTARTDFPRAQSTLESLAADDPTDTDALLALGEGELRLGHHDRTAKLAGQILERSPDHARALYLRGEALLQARRLDRARSDLEAALAQGPDTVAYAPARLALARCWLDLGDFARAQELFRAGAHDDPTNPLALFGAGRAASYLGQLEEAEASFLEVLKLQPGHVETLLALAQVVEQRGDLPRSLTYLEEAEQRDPNRLETLARLAKLHAALGHDKRAGEYEARYRALDPTRKPAAASKPKESP